MRVFTWNVHVGHQGREARQAEAVQACGADIVLLQELVEGKDHEAVLARGWPHVYFAPARRRRGGGRQGTLLLSRTPFTFLGCWDLSNHPLERRVALGVVLPGGLHLVTVHLDLTSLGRRRQMDRLERQIDAIVPKVAPLLLVGDCNDWNLSLDRHLASRGFQEAHRVAHGRCARTYPAGLPLLALDRIYGRGLTFTGAKRFAGMPWKNLSDHLPLMAEFALNQGPLG